MKRVLFLPLFLCYSLLAQRPEPSPFVAGSNGATIGGLNVEIPLTCAADAYILTWVAASSRVECLANAGASGSVTTSGLTSGAMVKASGSTSLTNAVAGVDYALPGPPVVPGYQPNQTLSGCGVEYVSGLTFVVGACSYTISGVTYSSALTSETLTAADLTNPRIDVIGVDTSGAAFVSTGTPAATPQQPTLDPANQLGLTFIYVPATATTPQGITIREIYEENTEWTSAVTANFNAASTNNPFRGSKDIEATSAVLTNSVTLTKPAAGTEDLSAWNTLSFYIRSKAAWPTGSGANAARALNVFFLNGSTQVGSTVVLRDGAFGFVSSTTSAYQQISIPLTLFGTGASAVTSIKFQVSGNGGSTSIGFYLDAITLQGGANPIVLPATLMNFRGAYSAATAYSVNDTVTSGGIGYVALAANTNIAVTTAATWRPLAGGAAGSTTQMQRNVGGVLGGVSGATSDGTTLFVTTQSASDNSTKAASTAYADAAAAAVAVKHAFICNIGSATGSTVIATGDTGCYSDSGSLTGTINRVDVIGNAAALATCSITVDIWKRNAAIPTASQKISASAPATLSTANVSQSGSLSGWTTSVANNDIWGPSVASVTGCVYATVRVEFQ